jgi:uncharacterized DUF497 family protein
MLFFEWDPRKAARNLRDHGIDFGAARAALVDPFRIEEIDQVVDGELRLRTTGMAEGQVVVLVAHANREAENGIDEIARIIHARKASPGERSEYERIRASGGWNPADR